MYELSVLYIAPLTFIISYFAAHTEKRWASMLCMILVFFFPPFILSPKSVNAIVITQLSDSLSLGLIIFNQSKLHSLVIDLSILAKTLVLGLTFAVAAAILVFIFTCQISIIILIPTVLIFGTIQIIKIRKKIDLKGNDLLNIIASSFISSATAFNQPLLVSLAKHAHMREGEQQIHAFLLLFILTLISGMLNLFFTLLRFSNSFPYATLILAMVGSVIGRLAAKAVPLRTNPTVFELVYYVLIILLVSIGTIIAILSGELL